MADTTACPECGASNWKQEGEYAMLKVFEGRALQFNVDSMDTDALVVRAMICGGCGYVKLYES